MMASAYNNMIFWRALNLPTRFIGTVVIGVLLFLSVAPTYAGSATLKIDPSQGTFFVGSSFDVSIILDTGGETINAVETELRFPPSLVQVTSPSASRSFIAIWTSPPTFSNEEGYVRFQGGVPSPGLKTSQGVLSTITFRAVQPGNVILELKNARVLRADGSGTDILGTALGARYIIAVPPPQGPRTYSPTHPEFSQWYRDSNVTIAWDKDEGVSEFSWSLDELPNTAPDTTSEGNQTGVTYKDIDDGLWYFHIRAKKGDVWGGVTTFPVKIDTKPPAMFSLELDPKESVTKGTRVLVRFRTTDELSGINRYEIKMVNVSGQEATQGSTFFVEGESPFAPSSLSLGLYQVIVRAYDGAGNFLDSSSTLEVREPSFSIFITEGINLGFVVLAWKLIFGILAGSGIIGGFTGFRFWLRHRHKKREIDKGIGNLRERLRRELTTIKGTLTDDLASRESVKEKLKNIERLAEGPPEEDSSASQKDSQQRTLSSFILFLIVSSFFIFSFSSAKPLLADEKKAFPAPKILTHQVEMGSNQLLYLTGIAPPASTVKIYISGENQQKITAQALANENGEWEHLHGLYLQPGFYRVWVEAQTSSGVLTEPSQEAMFKVVSRIQDEKKTFIDSESVLGFLTVLLTILDVGLLLFITYLWRRSMTLRRSLTKEIGEVNEALKIGFALLIREIEQDLALIEKDIAGVQSGKSDILGKERKLKQILLQDIGHIEESIRREVSDVERFL